MLLPASPTRSTGSAATSSGRSTPRASSTSPVDLGLDRRPPSRRRAIERLYGSLGLPAGDAAGPASLAERRAVRPVEPQLGRGLRHGGARECAAGARGDQLRDVGAAQRAVPARRQIRTDASWAGRTHYVSRVDHRRRAPVCRASPTRRWAMARGGSTCRRAASSSAPRRRRRCSMPSSTTTRVRRPSRRRWTRRTGSRCCGRARRSKGTAATTRRTCGRSGSPSSCCSTPSARVRSASPPRVSRARLRALARHTGRPSGGRAERLSGRLRASLDYAQVDEILRDDPHAYLAGVSRQCAQIHSAVYQSYISYPIESALPA